jgi:hypothetical protein
MRTIFRKIRKSHIDSSTGRNYILYAIGEIALVVIGILIALQINNWNEERNESQRFIEELKELRTELSDFDERLEDRAKSLQAVEAYGQYLQDFVNDQLEVIDTARLRKSIYYTGYLLVIEKSNSAYQNLVNEGDVKHIQNGDLKKALAVFYNKDDWRSYFHDNVILKSYQEYLRYIHKFTAPGSMRTLYEAEMSFITSDLSLSGQAIDRLDNAYGTMISWEKLRGDAGFKELIDHVLTVRYLQIRQYNDENRTDIARIISMIEQELENL